MSAFLVKEFINMVEWPSIADRLDSVQTSCLTTSQKSANWVHLIPRVSQISGQLPPVAEATEMVTFKENYQKPSNPEWIAVAMVDSRVADCTQAWPSASSPQSLHHRKHLEIQCSAWIFWCKIHHSRCSEDQAGISIQASVCCETDIALTQFRIILSSPIS